MNLTHCNGPYCPDGNCEGCKNYKLWCADQRCAPNCSECDIPEDNGLVLLIVLGVSVTILFLFTFIYIVGNGNPVVKETIKVNYYTVKS